MSTVKSRRERPRAESARVFSPSWTDTDALQPRAIWEASEYSDWRKSWTHIVSGRFTDSPYSALLFYEQSTGTAEFYSTDGNGGIALLRQHTGWRQSWTHIVAGVFRASRYTGFLLYDREAGFGAFYDVDGAGNIILIGEEDGWRTTWTHILAGRFIDRPDGEDTYSLLFYEQSTGYAEIYSTNGKGGIELVSSFDDWRTSWTHIVTANFADTGLWDIRPVDDLFFYEGSTGYGELYECDGSGGISLVSQHDNLPPATQVVAGNFGNDGAPGLFFYDRASGNAVSRDTPGSYPVFFDEYLNPDPTWDIVVGGNFWMADPEDRLFDDGGFTDLLFYDRSGGRGGFIVCEPQRPTPLKPFNGYASARSVLPGDTVGVHISSLVGAYNLKIYRIGATEQLVSTISQLPGTANSIGRTSYKTGAGWPESAQITIPSTWPSGLYVARVESPSIVVSPDPPVEARVARWPQGVPPHDVPFVIRAPSNRKKRILLAISDTTYEAYDFWGGRSLYGFGHDGQHAWVYPSSSPIKAPYGFRVSFLRGTAGNYFQYERKWQYWETPFIKWLSRNHFEFDVCAESDLDRIPHLLDGYRLVLFVGHSEYWSTGMRNQVESFGAKGGNVAFFSANVCWWQVRFEDDYNTMVCYKQKEFDPLSKSPATVRLTTVNWLEDYLQRPETELTGVRYGGNPAPDARMQFTVEDAGHWVFANSGLTNGSTFGIYGDGSKSVVGPETDCQIDISPKNFHRLASVKDPDGTEIATMGLFTRSGSRGHPGGTVFTAATIDWTLGLSQDAGWNAMDAITRNILIRLG